MNLLLYFIGVFKTYLGYPVTSQFFSACSVSEPLGMGGAGCLTVTRPCQNTHGKLRPLTPGLPFVDPLPDCWGGMLVSDASTYQYWWWWCWWWCGWWCGWYWCKLYWRVAVCISGRVLRLRGQRSLGSESYFQPWRPVDVIQGEFCIILFHLLHLSSLDGLRCCCSWQTARLFLVRNIGSLVTWEPCCTISREWKRGSCAPTICLCHVLLVLFSLCWHSTFTRLSKRS